MIILDTNVLSELMRTETSPSIRQWMGRFDFDDFYTTAVNEAEIMAGIAVLPPGRRRHGMDGVAHRMFVEQFAGRILPFESEAVTHYAEIVSMRRRKGRRIKPLDAMIVAIARANGASVATRNVRHFEGCGVDLQNPWSASTT